MGIPIKAKPCKGINKAKGFKGCEKITLHRQAGLCASCFYEWMTTNENGKIYKRKDFDPKVEKRQEQEKKRKRREENKKTKIQLMTADKYRAEIIQPMINKIARLIDYGHPCIATGNFGKMNGGHYISVGANRTTALHFHNIHIQSFESNHHRSGDTLNYQNGIREVYGQEYLDYMDSLKQIPPIHFTKQDYIDLKPKCKYVIESIEKQLEVRTPLKRITLRNWANRRLNVYTGELSFYGFKGDIEKQLKELQ